MLAGNSICVRWEEPEKPSYDLPGAFIDIMTASISRARATRRVQKVPTSKTTPQSLLSSLPPPRRCPSAFKVSTSAVVVERGRNYILRPLSMPALASIYTRPNQTHSPATNKHTSGRFPPPLESSFLLISSVLYGFLIGARFWWRKGSIVGPRQDGRRQVITAGKWLVRFCFCYGNRPFLTKFNARS